MLKISKIIRIAWHMMIVIWTVPSSANADLFTVQSHQLVHHIQLDGRLLPLTIFEIKPPIASQLVAVTARYGATVEEGEELIRFQSELLKDKIRLSKFQLHKSQENYLLNTASEYNHKTVKLKEQLENTKDQYKTSKLHYKQSKHLYDKGFLSQDELKQEKKILADLKRQWHGHKAAYVNQIKSNQTEQKQLKRRIIAEERTLKKLKEMKKNLIVKSPFNGVLLPPMQDNAVVQDANLLVTGQSFAAQDIIAVVAKLSPVLIVAKADEEDSYQLTVGDEAQVVFPMPSAQGPQTTIGRVIEIKPQLSRAVEKNQPASFSVALAVENVPSAISITFGTRVQLIFKQNKALPGWVIPKTAIFYEGGYPFCWVVTANDTEKRALRLGHSNEHSIEVIEGLAQDESIKRYA